MARGAVDRATLENIVSGFIVGCPRQLRGDTVASMIAWAEWKADRDDEAREIAEYRIYRTVRPLIAAGYPKQNIEGAALDANASVFREWEIWPLLRLYVTEHKRFQNRPKR